MKTTAFKYFSPLIIYAGSLISFTSHGLKCYSPLIYAWIVIPLLELMIRPDSSNMDEAEEEMAKRDKTYDLILYFIVLLQVPTLFYFLYHIKDPGVTLVDRIGRIGSMGLLCGTFGINIGHELGHRVNRFEQWLAKLSLMTSLYMHFFIEHNKGHHKNVATPEDPSSARYGELIYTFWFRSIVYSYTSAWKITNQEMRKKGKTIWQWKNEMIQAHVIQLLFIGLIYYLFGLTVLGYFFIAALIGILLLETVNYIEHYGLSRKPTSDGKYERAMPRHSWNSNHIIGRLMLFELSRHSDHHYQASRKYQILRHHDNAPQMPTGYPGMMILSLFPPIWFTVMNNRIRHMEIQEQSAIA